MKIGIFDSGIGGLSVLFEAYRRMDFGEFIYYADVDNVPYGEKKAEEIKKYSEDAIKFLIGKGTKAIVIACNTATSVAVSYLRGKYEIPIIGMEPAVKRAIDLYPEKRVIAAATPVTLKGEKLKALIGKVDDKHLVDLLALPELVRFAESGDFESDAVKEYLCEKFRGFDLDKYGSVVLGCTHFVFYKKIFREILPDNINLVDGNEGTVNQLIRRIESECEKDSDEKSIEFYQSSRKADEETVMKYKNLLKRLEE